MPSRRTALKSILAGAAALSTAPGQTLHAMTENSTPVLRKGNVRHSVCRWCYGGIPLEEFCVYVKQIGISAIDLIGPSEWDILKKHGLDSSMCNSAELNLVDGWNHREFHEKLIKNYSEMIPRVGKAGYKNLICFSGNRRGMDDETGLKNCVEGLQKIMPLAEKHGVTLCIEVFNSKIDHKDYMADNTPWTVELCKRLGSENFKILWDIYHMQINEGDVIRTIQEHHTYFAHYHTAGVPGRHEIDENQELNYPAIMRAIVATGFKGYVAQEFIPTAANPLASLATAIDLCDV